ncbi:hypothetical protein PZA11_004021 [Diplocarpon coronariae]
MQFSTLFTIVFAAFAASVAANSDEFRCYCDNPCSPVFCSSKKYSSCRKCCGSRGLCSED